MLALSVPILPVSSVHLHGPAVIPNDDQFPSLRRFCVHWVASEHRKFPFVTVLTKSSRRQCRLSSLDFESTPTRTYPLIPVFRESRFRPCHPRTFGTFAAKAAGNTLPQNERRKPSRMRTYTKRGEGGATLFRTQSTSVFVDVERRCHNGLLWGCGSIYPQKWYR
jgi:hypothetical protein